MNKPTTPSLKTRPPKAGTQDEALAKLDALEDWTKAPAASAAAAAELEGPAKPQKAARRREQQAVIDGAQPIQRKTPKARKPSVPASVKPWLSLLNEEGSAAAIKLMNFKCPIELFAQTRWLAQTTYGYTMTRIIIEALQEKNEKMLKDRGLA